MADFELTSDLRVAINGDFAVVQGDDFIRQRLITQLITNPTEYDANGEVRILGDHLYAPDFGIGIGRDVDSADTETLIAMRKQRVLQALRNEPGVDQTIPPTVQITFDKLRQTQYIRIEYVTINGMADRIGLKV